MGIYIKGMDFLPEDGTEFVVKKDEYGTWIKPIGHMGFSMRLIEIPEPHGRLIDADRATAESIKRTGKRLLAIDTAPTVIEAERSEDE